MRIEYTDTFSLGTEKIPGLRSNLRCLLIEWNNLDNP